MGWKDVEFTGADSAERVRRLQALCGKGKDAGAFDALLIIGGVDSYHSKVSQAVLKHLLLGSSGQELLGEQVLSQENDRLEDVVLLLTCERISIFYSSESDAAVKILPMISQWRNATEYVFHDAMDPDEQEKRKIQAFKQMVSSVKRIGIPYGVDSSGKDLQDVMIPEKWPLVQSYGLDDKANSKGFFTMNHQIVNVSSLLHRELTKLDDFSAKRVATEVAPMLTHHYNQFLMKLDHAETPAVRNAKSETEMGDDLLSFYDFGTTQHESRGLEMSAHRGSRVLFGKRTSQAATAASSSSMFLKNTGGVEGTPATHMLVQSEDPFTGVRFTRTYFLATGKLAPRVVDDDALVHQQAEASSKASEDRDAAAADTRFLIELYVLLLRGFRTAVREFVHHAAKESPSLAQCLAAAKTEAVRGMKNAPGKLPASFMDENLVAKAENLDACGRETAFPSLMWNVVYLSLEFKHVPSQFSPTESLGSLIVGDTLLFQSSPRAATLHLNTTSSFPYFRSWIQAGREAESVKASLSVLQSSFMLESPALRLGQPITPLDAAFEEGNISSNNDSSDPANSFAPSGAPPSMSSIGLSRAMLLLDCEELPLLHGSMQLFTGGFCFKTPQMIPMLVSFAKHVTSFRIVSTSYEELVLLQIELKYSGDERETAIAQVLPFSTSSSRTLAFPLLAGTRFQEEIIRALKVWKGTAESLEIPFYRPHDLHQYDGMTPRDDGTVNGSDLSSVMAKTCAELVRKSSDDATERAQVDKLFPRSFIPKDTNPSTTLPKPKKNDRSKICVPITVVLGLPGSSAASVAATITNVSSAAYEWECIEIDCRDDENAKGTSTQEAYAVTQIQKRVGTTLQRILTTSSATDLPPRLLLCVVGYVDAQAVASAIKSARSWPLQTKIASIIGCVSATNSYLPDPLGAQCPLPKLFDQLMTGFTTHIVVTHASDVASSTLGRLRYRIDQVNAFADIHVLSSDVFEGSLTPLLCVDRFENGYYKTYRDTKFPGWATATTTTSNGSQMDPALVPESVRFEIAPGIEKTRFLQSVGKTLTPFAQMTKSMDKIHPMEPHLMAKQQQQQQHMPTKQGGIRLAQSLATEKVLSSSQTRSATEIPQDDQEEYGDCWCVEALVSFAGDVSAVYEYVSTGSYVRMRTMSNLQHGSADNAVATKPMEIKITGRNLQIAKIRDLILGCYVKLDGAVQPLRTKPMLTIQEKREIQKQHVMDDLPEGFYYDGITYVDQFGGRHEFHPRMSEFLDDHVRSLNEATKQHNVQVEENRKSQQTFVRQIGHAQ